VKRQEENVYTMKDAYNKILDGSEGGYDEVF